MLKLNSFLNECCFKGCNMGLNVKKKKTPRFIGHRGVETPRYLGLFWIISGSSFATPKYIEHRGVLSHKVLKSLDSPVHRTPGSFDSPVLRTILDHQQINYCDSPVHRTPGSHFKMPITQPIGKKNWNGPRTCLMGPGGVVWGKKLSTKNLVRLSL